MGFLKTLFFIFLFYYSFKVISRILAPFLIRYLLKKAQKSSQAEFRQRTNNQYKTQEGEVFVSKSKKTKTTSKNVGEYVDFEEIDENE